jgi:type II secretory pathway pseudopilin PulG
MQFQLKYKKAAMFGLDARIALTIFGALSIISGATLYNVMQNIKANQWQQYFANLVKASEAYYLDHGRPISQQNATNAYIARLVNNNEPSNLWKGPYITNFTQKAPNAITGDLNKTIYADSRTYIILSPISKWSRSDAPESCTTNDTDCAEYFRLHCGFDLGGVENLKNLFPLLDKLVDNSDGETSGKVRVWNTAPDNYSIMYQGVARKNTM